MNRPELKEYEEGKRNNRIVYLILKTKDGYGLSELTTTFQDV
jgi:hypothetical protein